MQSLIDLRDKLGWFEFPDAPEMHVAVERLDRRVRSVLPAVPGFTGRLARAARLDLASKALTEGDGYGRRVRSFHDLPRAELAYVEAWVGQADLAAELTQLGWLPQPSPQRILRLLQEDSDLPVRTRDRLIKAYIVHDN